ncbi:MAG: dihydroxyacetone kinase subunit DhaK [Trueperaceae bacterium]|nr:dihydroxyacetone kinase subunit DhaK [Trueperaceae bacterium]
MNDPDRLVDDMIDGYVAAYGDLVSRGDHPRVVVRRRSKPRGRVGIAIGNGSGHEPIALGWIGAGMLDANAVGEVFAAPPPDLVLEAIRASDRGAGVLLLVSRHAGDVINAEMAVELARAEGLRVEPLLMYDDVSSAPKGREEDRRGAPGTTFVYKVVGARAEEGASLDELVALGSRVRDATRTLAAALAPGVSPLTGRPMFSLPEGEVFLGMGVHGEPGLRSVTSATADELVREMMPEILDDLPFERGDEVLVLVNGMGGTTLMELLVVHRSVAAVLEERGVVPYRPLVGSFVTTQEMAGFSISLCRLDDEIRRAWDAPVRAPFFHRPEEANP